MKTLGDLTRHSSSWRRGAGKKETHGGVPLFELLNTSASLQHRGRGWGWGGGGGEGGRARTKVGRLEGLKTTTTKNSTSTTPNDSHMIIHHTTATT